MQDQLLPGTRLGGEKPFGTNQRPKGRRCQQAGRLPRQQPLDFQRHPPWMPVLDLIRFVLQSTRRDRNAGWRESEWLAQRDPSGQTDPVQLASATAPAADDDSSAPPAEGDMTERAFSSFIIGEGVVTGPVIFTVR